MFHKMLRVSRLKKLPQQPVTTLTPHTLWKMRKPSISQIRHAKNNNKGKVLAVFLPINIFCPAEQHALLHTSMHAYTLSSGRGGKSVKCHVKAGVGVRKSFGPMMPQPCHPTSWCYVAPRTEIASVTCVLVPEILPCCLW